MPASLHAKEFAQKFYLNLSLPVPRLLGEKFHGGGYGASATHTSNATFGCIRAYYKQVSNSGGTGRRTLHERHLPALESAQSGAKSTKPPRLCSQSKLEQVQQYTHTYTHIQFIKLAHETVQKHITCSTAQGKTTFLILTGVCLPIPVCEATCRRGGSIPSLAGTLNEAPQVAQPLS